MSIQDRNAGNAGDQLKHALLLELITHLPTGPPWAYSETHAGAGSYATPNAALLFRRAWEASGRNTGGPGDAYAMALSCWWQERAPVADLPPTHADAVTVARMPYPGSAALGVMSGALHGAITLAEADPAVLARLERTLEIAGGPPPPPDPAGGPCAGSTARLLAGSFERHLSALLAPNPLILLVDPYFYQSAAPDGDGGRLGAQHIATLARELGARDAVMLIFTSHLPEEFLTLGTADGLRRGTWEALCADLAQYAPPQLRVFRAQGTPHAVVIAGWGRGSALVRNLPGQGDWRRSWLASPPIGLEILEVAAPGGRP